MRRIPSSSPIIQAACWLTSVLMLFSACSKQSEFEYIDEAVETVQGETNVVVTDENGNKEAFASGSQIGIYVIAADGSVTYQMVEVDEDGNAALPTSSQGSTIIAYTPYQEAWGEEAIMNNPVFTIQSDQSNEVAYDASDLMIGKSVATAGTRGYYNRMAFRHMLAKVAIHVVDETGRIDLKNIKAELLSVNNSVRVDLLHQSVSTIDDSRVNIQMLSEMTTDWRISSYAIVAPQDVAEGTTFFAITLYGNRQNYPIPQDCRLEGSKTYTINMRLTEYGLIPDGWYITDWEDEGEKNIDIELY